MPSGEVIALILKLDDTVSKSRSEKDLDYLNHSLAIIMAEIIIKLELIKKTKCHLRIIREDEV